MKNFANIHEYSLTFFDANDDEVTSYRSSEKNFFPNPSLPVATKDFGVEIKSINDLLNALTASHPQKYRRFILRASLCSSKTAFYLDSKVCSINYTHFESNSLNKPTSIEQTDFTDFVESIAGALNISIVEPRLGPGGYVNYEVVATDYFGYLER